MLAQQQAVIDELTSRVEEMSYQSKAYRREIAELHLAIEKMLKGNRREKFDDPKQLKLEFPDDPELQDALQEAQAEAAEIFETITYERRRRRENKKKGSERLPEHLRREYVNAVFSAMPARSADTRSDFPQANSWNSFLTWRSSNIVTPLPYESYDSPITSKNR